MLFISYTHSDVLSVRSLRVQLTSQQTPHWCADTLATGASFPREMNDGLATASHLAVLWSLQASRSDHVWNEIDAFYARHPQPQRMVFIRLDETNVPALFASRLYLPKDGGAAAWARALHPWLEGTPSDGIWLAPIAPGAAEASFVSLVPPGPAVRTKHISRELIDQYALHVANRFEVATLLDEVARLREAAEPQVQANQLLTPGELLRIGEVAPRDFWIDTFAAAARKGTRTLAALLLAQPDENFSDAARQDRIRLLTGLRRRDTVLFT